MKIKDIYEGLIKSHNLEQTKSLFQRNIPVDNNGILKIYLNKKDNTLKIDLVNVSSLDIFFSFLNLTGYFISDIVYETKEIKDLVRIKYDEKRLKELYEERNHLERLIVTLEAKFDLERELPDEIYHLTNEKNLEKIKKIGLTPKTKSKLSSHSDRIYLALKKDDLTILLPTFKYLDSSISDKPLDYYILTIKTEGINNLRLFDDPNFKTFGVYTLVNIPPNAITKIEKI